MPGPNTWMSTPTPQWAEILPHLGPSMFQLDKIELEVDPSEQANYNATRGLKPEEIPTPSQVEIRNFTIQGRDGKPIKVRSYTPIKASPDEKFPVLTWAHHGGWKIGNLESDDITCRYISLHRNFVVVNIEYALIPNRFPVALDNVHDVVIWIAQNHKSIRVDPSLGFILGGSSAGANMSAVVAHLMKNYFPNLITGQLFSIGWFLDQKHKDKLDDVPQQWIDEMTSIEDNKDAALCSAETIEAIMGPDWLDVDSTLPIFSPALFPRSSFKGLPPAYIQIAGQDPFRDEGVLYARLLERGGAATKVRPFPGVPHAWFEFEELDEAKLYVKDLTAGVGWLQERLGEREVCEANVRAVL